MLYTSSSEHIHLITERLNALVNIFLFISLASYKQPLFYTVSELDSPRLLFIDSTYKIPPKPNSIRLSLAYFV